MKRALATLVVGEPCRQRFATHAAESFRAYAKAHGLSLVVLDRLIDDSELGRSRSPAWQKCLLFKNPRLRACDQVLWLDADIVIRPNAPNIFDTVPPGILGAVEQFSSPTPEAYASAQAKTRRYLAGQGLASPEDATPQAFYRHYGFADGPDAVVQTGVMVLAPEVHGPAMAAAYAEERRPDSRDMLYEMRPLSYHLLRAGPVRWLDPRFNALWATTLILHYPFLMEPAFLAAYRDRPELLARLKAACLGTAADEAHFLHFAGVGEDMRYLLPARA
ncbi:hypothetical protein GTA51_16340 [Desulfovibrio aerotolerans]|uniref:Glycosyltransferase family 8 protein n=1 Tax=Solidesulfovibrio aerotolerans TaxID=295255 RepID=A0A7C9INE7_9BACT|nr:hypothetical protein [Solidesulfovibrio aerotolerans]MYL84684.1 hypothetical protein [Solidesulfovibrio aerotolerans]